MKEVQYATTQASSAKRTSTTQLIAEMNEANRPEAKIWLLLTACAWVLLALSLWGAK